MRTISSLTSRSMSRVAMMAVIAGAAACSAQGSSTIIGTGSPTPGDGTTAGTDPTTPADPTNPAAGTPDPSMMGDPTSKDTPAPPLVTGVAISGISVFQAVKVPVVTAGKVVAPADRNSPVVAKRPALIRVYVKPDSTYKGGSITAELRLVDGTTSLPVVKDTKSISGASTDATIASTFNFEVPPESLPPGVTYQVLLTQTGGVVPTGTSTARFPNDGGVQSLDVMTSGTLKIVVVPVKYQADGSGRIPDVSAAQLARYKQTFMARYPAETVEITARAPWTYSSAISANGNGFSAVLNAVTNLRKTDGVAADVYYYGALAPTSSFNSFCGGGCVTGLSTVVDSPQTSFLRASVGVGYTGDDSVNTAAHEVGHAHGRNHAPCGGASGVDPNFPYSNASIGTWGYDIFAKTFLAPTVGKDMMGYCPNEWVSDYTYTALFDRIASLNGNPLSNATGTTAAGSGNFQASTEVAGPSAHEGGTFRMANVAADGAVTWTNDIELDQEPTAGKSLVATFTGANGGTVGTHTAHFYPYDHLPGGVLVVPSAPKPSSVNGFATKAQLAATWSTVHVAGLANPLTR
ncbi:MAG: hypothetical protein QOI41_1063 [Myxococcales bacterium]|nr:hypothetical protein [Myxococcales bacterium]